MWDFLSRNVEEITALAGWLGVFVSVVAVGIIVYWNRRKSREGKKTFEFEKRKFGFENQPDVRAWLDISREKSETGKGNPYLNLVIGNIGQGVAREVRWWLDKEVSSPWGEWEERRVLGRASNLPCSREHGVFVDILRPGVDKVYVLLSVGSLMYEEDSDCWDPLSPFEVWVEFKDFDGIVQTHNFVLDSGLIVGDVYTK